MKRKMLLTALCLLCALLLIGCSNAAPASTPAPSPTESAEPAAAPSPVAATPAPSEEPVSEASTAPVATLPDAGLVHDTAAAPSAAESLFELAKGYVDKPLSELQAEIGEPSSSSYASSCLIPGGQDGELHYDGFTVYTVKSGDTETILDVLTD